MLRLDQVMTLLYAGEHILGSRDLRDAALQYLDDWSLGESNGLCYVQPNLTSLTVTLNPAAFHRANHRVQPARDRMDQGLTSPDLAPPPSELPRAPIVDESKSFDSTNSGMYFDPASKSGHGEGEGEGEAGEDDGEAGEGAAEGGDRGLPSPSPSEEESPLAAVPPQPEPPSQAQEIRKQLLNLFLRASKAKHVAPSLIKKACLRLLGHFYAHFMCFE